MKQILSKTPFFRLFAFILAVVCVISTYTIYIEQQENENAIMTLSKIGSRGEEVRRIQTKLKQLGFYNGSIDGIYGSATQKAVKRFQSSVGITSDGIAGSKTLLYLGLDSSSGGGSYGSYSSSDMWLLAKVIEAEARGESYVGQVAVGAVVMNRIESSKYPNDIDSVIYQRGQFGPAGTGKLNRVLNSGGYTATSLQAAEDALNGVDPVEGCLYFGCGRKGIKIGAHYFH